MKNSFNNSQNSNLFKNSLEVDREIDEKRTEKKFKLDIPDAVDKAKRGRSLLNSSKRSSGKNSKEMSQDNSPAESLKKLKNNLMNEKLSDYMKKNKLDDTIDNDPIVSTYHLILGGFTQNEIQNTKTKKNINPLKPSKQDEILIQGLEGTQQLKIDTEEKSVLSNSKLSELNIMFVKFLQIKFGIDVTNRMSIPLDQLILLYEEFFTIWTKSKSQEIKNSAETYKLTNEIKSLNTEMKILEEKLNSELLLKKEEDNRLEKTLIDTKESKKRLMKLEKENFLLKRETVSAMKSKRWLMSLIKKDNLSYKELLSNLINDVNNIETD